MQQIKRLPPRARSFMLLVIALGLTGLFYSLMRWESREPVRYFSYFGLAVLASLLRVHLPSVSGTLSVSFLFVLIGLLELSLPETLLLGCTANLVHAIRDRRRVQPLQNLFVVATTAIAIATAFLIYHSAVVRDHVQQAPLVLLVTATGFFLMSTFPVAVVIGLTEGLSLRRIWHEAYLWSYPYYLVGAATAGLLNTANQTLGWQTALLLMPMAYLLWRSYKLYLERMDYEKHHAETMASLHLRTIEALALAIEAKDHSTHDHLQRVQVYAVEIGKELGLSEDELEALRAASVLHDIGKLAVPEHIISKPGRLSPEEFEKMKIHPVVGAEIVEQVGFPYPVAPIVRHHHEKWDGTGYPDGLRGEAIPIGARILSAVDCLDALATDRQYRKALPLDEAMRVVASEIGRSYDPAVVEVLARRYPELERLAQARRRERLSTSREFKVARDVAPAAGFERPRKGPDRPVSDFLSSIAAARQEIQGLFELSQHLGNSLSLDETLSVLAVRLKRMVPYDSLVVYVQRDGILKPEYVAGDNFRLFSSLEIPVGQGLSGWVAESRQPILNGNPSLEPGYKKGAGAALLRSAAAVPLEGVNGVVGVLSLYHSEKDAFDKDHLRILLAITSKVSVSIENAMKYRQAETSSTTDYLTGLPNARSLFLHLDAELARCRRTGGQLAVLVCDLDGFKRINESFGHLLGDKVLNAVAQALRDGCREYDYIARMGGDEFVLVLPGLKAQDVPGKAARLDRAAAAAAKAVRPEAALSLTAAAAFFPDDGNDAEQLLAEADQRMYLTKRKRRLGGDTPDRFDGFDFQSVTVQ